MKTKKRRKRKLRIGRIFLLLISVTIIYFLCIKLSEIKISNIIIKGNNLLTDIEIIKEAKLEDYPSYFKTFTYTIKNRLKHNPYINEVKVTKGIFSIKINIVENKVLYIKKSTNEKVTINSVFNDEKTVCAPFLINEVPSDKIEKFKNAMNKIDDDMLCQISEIKYDPNDIDKDRYYLNMNDGNGVYLTVNKFKKINNYNKILENVGKQNGILYLDYGDYFKAY